MSAQTIIEVAASAPAARPRLDATRIAVGFMALLLALLVIPPLWFLLQGSLYTTTPTGHFGEFTFSYYNKLANDRRFLSSLWNSTVFALGSACLAILLAGLSRGSWSAPMRRSSHSRISLRSYRWERLLFSM